MQRRHFTQAFGFTPWVIAAPFALPFAAQAQASAAVGQPAPDVAVVDVSGQPQRLSSLRGQWVVLEWTNPGCPFVQKHYNSGNIPATQKDAVAQGVQWISVSTTERNHPDWLPADKLTAWLKTRGGASSHIWLDEDGRLGQAFGARTTPHLYIVNPQGTLVYAGGIDSIPSAKVEDIAKATNYIKQALGEALAGKTISQANTRAYGCSVKYKV